MYLRFLQMFADKLDDETYLHVDYVCFCRLHI